MQYNAYAAYEAKANLKPFSYDSGELGPNEIEVKISHCGICHSDIHLINNDWMISQYPLVPGHEIVGYVTGMGSEVKGFREGDRVGIGWQCGSCGECHLCESGQENLCGKSQATCNGHHGGYADYVRSDAGFVIHIPEGLDSAEAAPLLCGGITVFSPLDRHGIKPGMKVGIFGIGGLGHMAVQFASKMGAETYALSSSPDKAREASELGAAGFINMKDKNEMLKHLGSFDYILSTISADYDWNSIISLLKHNATLCYVGAAPSPVAIHAFTFISKQINVTGSAIGSPEQIRKMLEFAAEHGVKAMVETVPMSDVQNAMARVVENKVRYRMVLENK